LLYLFIELLSLKLYNILVLYRAFFIYLSQNALLPLLSLSFIKHYTKFTDYIDLQIDNALENQEESIDRANNIRQQIDINAARNDEDKEADDDSDADAIATDGEDEIYMEPDHVVENENEEVCPESTL